MTATVVPPANEQEQAEQEAYDLRQQILALARCGWSESQLKHLSVTALRTILNRAQRARRILAISHPYETEPHGKR